MEKMEEEDEMVNILKVGNRLVTGHPITKEI